MEFYPNFDSSNANLPPGYRFHPTDEELITYYLLKKVLDGSFTGRAIADVDLNKCEPWELPGKAKMGEKEWYFFSLRDRKYPTGLRTNRATEAGYWKATGKDREIYSTKSASLVGMKKTLVFYKGRAPKGEKSNWVMHEYRLEGKLSYHYISQSSKDEWVISRVFQKSGAGGKKRLLASMSFNHDVSSPSSVSLPPLLDSSPYAGAATSGDYESFSYDTKEHVSCFSTNAATTNFNPHSLFEFTPPPLPLPFNPTVVDPLSSSSSPRFSRNYGGLSAFPSLRSLQENLQLPFFFSAVVPPPPSLQGGASDIVPGGYNSSAAAPEDQKCGPTELDCIWSF
ncbi:hypothetical protein LguiB_030044 [Lonicera macranthoides]